MGESPHALYIDHNGVVVTSHVLSTRLWLHSDADDREDGENGEDDEQIHADPVVHGDVADVDSSDTEGAEILGGNLFLPNQTELPVKQEASAQSASGSLEAPAPHIRVEAEPDGRISSPLSSAEHQGGHQQLEDPEPLAPHLQDDANLENRLGAPQGSVAQSSEYGPQRKCRACVGRKRAHTCDPVRRKQWQEVQRQERAAGRAETVQQDPMGRAPQRRTQHPTYMSQENNRQALSCRAETMIPQIRRQVPKFRIHHG